MVILILGKHTACGTGHESDFVRVGHGGDAITFV